MAFLAHEGLFLCWIAWIRPYIFRSSELVQRPSFLYRVFYKGLHLQSRNMGFNV